MQLTPRFDAKRKEIKIPKKLAQRLEAYSNAVEKPQTEIILEALREYLNRLDQQNRSKA